MRRLRLPRVVVLTLLVLPGLLTTTLLADVVTPGSPPDPRGASVRNALQNESLPWYDGAKDRVTPFLSEPDWEESWLKRFLDWVGSLFEPIGNWFRGLNGWTIPGVNLGLGNTLLYGVALLAFALLAVALLEFLRRYRSTAEDRQAKTVTAVGRTERIEGLPTGLPLDLSDPLEMARRLRASGDYEGATIYLFAHQLLTLSRAGRLRLLPGRTGRQLIRSVASTPIRETVQPTLELFESVYYGHRKVGREAFEEVWALIDRFERLQREEDAILRGGLPAEARAVMLLALLTLTAASGCSEGVDRTYGKIKNDSVNGTSLLAGMFRERGHQVRPAVRLTEELGVWADVIVRVAPFGGPPPREEAEWYDRWMADGYGRRLVYIARDYDGTADYWERVLEQLPGDARPRLRQRVKEALDEAKPLGNRSWASAVEPADPNDWFAVDPPYDVTNAATSPTTTKKKSRPAPKVVMPLGSGTGMTPHTCRALDGVWARGVNAEQAALPRRRSLKRPRAVTLLSGDDSPLALSWFHDQGNGRVLALASGAFVLNAPIASFPARRPLASRVVEWAGYTGDEFEGEPGDVVARRVAFVEGLNVTGDEAGPPSVFDLLWVDPFGRVAAQVVGLALVACLARAPRLGRARPEEPSGVERPSAHPEALGALLAKAGQVKVARSILDAYRVWRPAQAARSPRGRPSSRGSSFRA